MCQVLCTGCAYDYGLRTLQAKEIEGQMSIVTQLPDVLAQSRAFINMVHQRCIAW